MGVRQAELAMEELEASTSSLNCGKVEFYCNRIKAYASRKNELHPNQPVLFDVSAGTVTLPPHLEQRIESWMRSHPEYSPFMRKFARFYLIELQGCEGSEPIYKPLAEAVLEGVDFYIENGIFFLQDAGGVWAGD